jgi:hypothetical protein
MPVGRPKTPTDSTIGFISGGDHFNEANPRWALVEKLFERLLRLLSHWGVAPSVAYERLSIVAQRLGNLDTPSESELRARTYDEVHSSAEILRLWFQDPDFVEQDGYPRKLFISGRSPNFTDIVRLATSGMEVPTALKELMAAGAVKVGTDGSVAVESRLVACDGAARRAEVGLYAAENLLASVERNVEHPSAKDALQCETVSLTFDRAQLPRVARHLRRQCIGMLEQTDDWLHEHSGGRSRASNSTATVAVGLYITVRAPDQAAVIDASAVERQRVDRRSGSVSPEGVL